MTDYQQLILISDLVMAGAFVVSFLLAFLIVKIANKKIDKWDKERNIENE